MSSTTQDCMSSRGSLTRRAFAAGVMTAAAPTLAAANIIGPRLILPKTTIGRADPGNLVHVADANAGAFFSMSRAGLFAATPTGLINNNRNVCWKSTSGAGEVNYYLYGEQEYYQSSNGGYSPFSAQNGALAITASHAPQGSNPAGQPYNSGMINTYTLPGGCFTGARIDVRAKLPKGNGLWPAIWMCPTNNQWPPEIDVMEMLGEDPTTIYQSLHWGPDGNDASVDKYTQPVKVADTSAGFHNFGLDFDSTVENSQITFYFDNQPTYQTTLPSRMNGQTWYLMINLAVGGQYSWGGAPNAATKFPASMLVSSINLYPPGTILS